MHWYHGVRQDLVNTDGTRGAAIGTAPVNMVVLTGSQWQSYEQLGGREQSRAPEVIGFPTGEEWVHGRYTVLELDQGGALISELPTGPYSWLAEHFRPQWKELGGFDAGLGAPTSNPYAEAGQWRQDFTYGYAMATSELDPDPEIVVVDDPASSLPPDLEGVIIRQSDGTAWWIPEPGQRLWIHDGGTWDCLGGIDLIAHNTSDVKMTETPGYVVATLTYTENASCG